ncbi:MAG: metallophosphoesterase [Ignavibacteria bacterium]|nr:metallophosphoesterase [Ignavibacteria bacterium]
MISVIGDIHGCYNTLKELYGQIKSKYPQIEVYAVGDLVDRGNFSCEVIHFCISNDIKVCLGNHDYMFLQYFREPFSPMARAWVYNGHMPTLNSYKNNPKSLEPHLEYVENLRLFYNTKDAFICHAGISKVYKKYFKEYNLDGSHDKFIEKVVSQDLDSDNSIIWVREGLINIGKLQIIGHTRKFETMHDKNSNVYYIDTGCAYGNKLTAVIVDDNEVIDKIQVPVYNEDIIQY